ncbi:MAG: hypothetical protein WAM61_12795 [Desulfobacterales bacterium]
MAEQRIPIWLSIARFVREIRLFATSSVGSRARWMLAALVIFLFIINGLNVVNSYVNRHFMTAIADRDYAEFARQALFYIGVFAASTLVSVLSSFTEQRLDLLWREFITRDLGRSVDPCDPAAAKLEIQEDGSWTWTDPAGGPPVVNDLLVDAMDTT